MCSHGQDNLLKVKLSIRKDKEGDVSGFEHGFVVGAIWASMINYKLLIYLDFQTQPSLRFTENSPNKIISSE